MIPYGRQEISEADVAAVVEVLRSDWLTQGPAVPRFEEAVASRCGAKHAVAVNSGTSALHIACMALDLGPGDWLWTSPITFVASANCALYCGASVDFVDIDPGTGNMSAEALEAKLAGAASRGKLPKIVVPVHFGGQPCDMKRIGELSSKYGFRVIEDASHAVGASYQGEPVGKCVHSDVAVFSFHPVKIMTTAEGGMALTNEPSIAERMARLRTHGITRDAAHMTRPPDGAWYYQQVELGYNYRMTDMQAALGGRQLERLDGFISSRERLADRYDDALRGLPIVTLKRGPDRRSSWHLYVIRVPERPGLPGRKKVFDKLRASGIGVNVHYIPVHLQPYYERFGFRPGDFPVAERFYAEAITLPLFQALSAADQDKVVRALAEAIQAAKA